MQEARSSGESMFMGLPDAWYEPTTYADVSGHISHSYLKSEEKGNVCLDCQKPLFLVPPQTTEEEVKKILNI